MKTADVILILLACLLILACVFLLAPPVAEKGSLQEQLHQAQEEVERLKGELADMDQQIDKLKRGDRETIESVARDKFGLAKEGEVIYQIPRQTEEK